MRCTGHSGTLERSITDVQVGFRKGRGTRNQIANIRWIIEKAREFQKKTSISALSIMSKPLTVWITIKILQEMGIPEHLTYVLRNLYAGQETTVRTGYGTTNWFQNNRSTSRLLSSPAYLTSMQNTS